MAANRQQEGRQRLRAEIGTIAATVNEQGNFRRSSYQTTTGIYGRTSHAHTVTLCRALEALNAVHDSPDARLVSKPKLKVIMNAYAFKGHHE